jgi:hypothetical protein
MEKNMTLITKASGEIETFKEDKLRLSLERSGVDAGEIEKIVREISNRLNEDISTNEIYRIAFNMLKKDSWPFAAKYHLKRAIMELGPSGYPFERFIGEILRHQGYSVRVGEIVRGLCVNHEIDVIAEKEHYHFMVECKYHNQPGNLCSVKIPLYIQARFKDVESAWQKLPGHATKFHQGWVITNTKFSSDSIQYGNCAGLKMLGWNYPSKGSLRELIDSLGLYPITCLTTLTKLEKQNLLDRKIVLCKDICTNERYLIQAGVGKSRINAVLEEGHKLCHKLISDGKH